MKKRKVLSRKNLPTRLPVTQAAVAYLLLDKINAAGWVWGAVGTIFFILWVLCIISKYKQEEVEVDSPHNNDIRQAYYLYDEANTNP